MRRILGLVLITGGAVVAAIARRRWQPRRAQTEADALEVDIRRFESEGGHSAPM